MERWKLASDADPIDTWTAIVTTPNELMKPIHNRMPVIVDARDDSRGLDREIGGADFADVMKPW